MRGRRRPIDPQIPKDGGAVEPTPIDAALVARVRAGNARAFETVFRRYYDRLYRFAYSCVEQQDVAEEIVQSVFAAIWEHRAQLAIVGTVESYLFGAVRKGVLSMARHDRVVSRHAIAVQAEETSGRVEPADARLAQDELRAAVAEAIASLPERTRQVFVLHREHHLRYAEIAAATQLTLKGVEYHMGVALRHLRKLLADFTV
jgi:RNA polymerase sigma-70 factor (ECF subfamily)